MPIRHVFFFLYVETVSRNSFKAYVAVINFFVLTLEIIHFFYDFMNFASLGTVLVVFFSVSEFTMNVRYS